MKAKLIINNVEVVLGHKEMLDISLSLDDCHKNEGIFHELAKSECTEIRNSVTNYSHIKLETIDLLLRDKSIDVLRYITNNYRVKSMMIDENIEYLLSTGDTDILSNIASDIDLYVNEFNVCKMDWICNKLINQRDPAVRYELASNEDIPRKFLERLSKDDDFDVANKAKQTLMHES